MRTRLVALKRHCTGQNGHVQPQHRKQTQDLSSQGSRLPTGCRAAKHPDFV